MVGPGKAGAAPQADPGPRSRRPSHPDDEQRFAVDGAYNVRDEGINKRIDKAVVQGTRKRVVAASRRSG